MGRGREWGGGDQVVLDPAHWQRLSISVTSAPRGWDVMLSTGRWSVVQLGLGCLLRVEGVLKKYFDVAKFSVNETAAARTDVDVVDDKLLKRTPAP